MLKFKGSHNKLWKAAMGLKEDVLSFREKGQVVLLGDFNTCVGRSVEVYGMFGEETYNASGNSLPE